MNVGGVVAFLRFYFGRNPQEDLSASSCWHQYRYLNDSHYESGKMFVASIHAIRACFRKHNIQQFIFVQSSYSKQHQPTSSSSLETLYTALSSLSLSVCNDFASFSDSFKYFHTSDTFAALVHLYLITSRHCLVFSLIQFRLPNIQCIPRNNHWCMINSCVKNTVF